MIFDDLFGFVLFSLISSFTRSLTPLGYLETTRLEKLLRLLAARRQTDEYETSFDKFYFLSCKFCAFDITTTKGDSSNNNFEYNFFNCL